MKEPAALGSQHSGPSALLLGAHVPVAGGLHLGPANGQEIGATAIQIFTRNQRQWACRPLDPDEPAAFKAALAGSGIGAVMAHASYLINLASLSPDFLARSRANLADEILRCDALGVPSVVVHPGAHMGAGEEAGLRAVARSLDEVHQRTRGARARTLLEVTAGQGSCLGHRFEHLAAVLSLVKAPERVGVCLDTCHLLAAGYDIAHPRGFEETMAAFERVVGLPRLQAVHLNDSRTPLGSRVDRHARTGEGHLGLPAFRRLLNDPRLRAVPMVVETPGPLSEWKKELARLRGLVDGAAPRRRRPSPARPRAARAS